MYNGLVSGGLTDLAFDPFLFGDDVGSDIIKSSTLVCVLGWFEDGCSSFLYLCLGKVSRGELRSKLIVRYGDVILESNSLSDSPTELTKLDVSSSTLFIGS